ncbi:winged helix-turn-helix transcriptional regulator [Psychromicrobium lacuslunae]|uniref:HTH hxlR-type domain-containing protein n=1 Tax=Psychromicrobium lacuslunae TaxID=1618207 RepID=A0A0D4BZR8_9MICC|nr:helix-turn-helix domain-containing protein [Psychromicrobium lacuslunae]AJT41809.1 hypothetical protein UM93_10285 [Psychromicrobium lacuslunae]
MTKQSIQIFDSACPLSSFPAQLGSKWQTMILLSLAEQPKRFTELEAGLAKVTRKVLSETLRRMEHDGFVLRTDFFDNPPKVSYSLTELGLSLLPLIEASREWTREHFASVLAERERRSSAD